MFVNSLRQNDWLEKCDEYIYIYIYRAHWEIMCGEILAIFRRY